MKIWKVFTWLGLLGDLVMVVLLEEMKTTSCENLIVEEKCCNRDYIIIIIINVWLNGKHIFHHFLLYAVLQTELHSNHDLRYNTFCWSTYFEVVLWRQDQNNKSWDPHNRMTTSNLMHIMNWYILIMLSDNDSMSNRLRI